MQFIEIKNITMGYEGVPVLDNLSFEVNKGDYLCIVGENGSGKTTLMKGLLGLCSPISGKIAYNELSKNEIGYLPQSKNILKNFPASVMEVVLSGCKNLRFGAFHTKKNKETALKNLERVRMSEYANNSFGELSGGQQQRVLLARALCATEKLIVLDEPVTGLDPIATVDMYDLIREINENGTTVIMVTHDINSAVRQASHILHISSDEHFYGTSHSYIHSNLGNKFLLTECPCDVCTHTHSKEDKNV